MSKEKAIQFASPGPSTVSIEDLRTDIKRLSDELTGVRRQLHAKLVAEMDELLTGTENQKQKLTQSELRVLNLSLKGQANKEIAWELQVSPSTVKFHLTHIFGKLGIHSKRDLLTSERFESLLP